MIDNVFLGKDFYSTIAMKLEEDEPLYEFEMACLINGLKGNERFKTLASYIMMSSNQNAVDWLTKALNDHFSFAVLRNTEGVYGFRIEERDDKIEQGVDMIAYRIFAEEDARQ